MRVTGERIVTPHGGFNASWQRHAACYAMAARFLGPGTVLDIGCGTGHAHPQLKPRAVVGIDRDEPSIAQAPSPGVVADMRTLPFASGSFPSIACMHAIEHVPDAPRIVAECARVLAPEGVAVYATPNRLTFGRPDEIIDPYHFVEYDAHELESLCRTQFDVVRVFGVFGSPRYMAHFDQERRRLRILLALDPLRIRRLVPRRTRQWLYDRALARSRLTIAMEDVSEVTIDDFELREAELESTLDLLAVCSRGR